MRSAQTVRNRLTSIESQRFEPLSSSIKVEEARVNPALRKPVESVRAVDVPTRERTLPSPPGFEPLLDLHEAADILGMHWKTLESKARGREVPAFKVGKRWRFRLSSLNQWLEHGINSNTTDQAVVTR